MVFKRTILWYRTAVKVNQVICNNYSSFSHLSVVNFSQIQVAAKRKNILSNCTLQSIKISAKMATVDSSYDWLEDVSGEKSMTWVKEHNARTLQGKNIEDSDLYQRTIDILNSKEKIPGIRKIGEFWYNFWQDETHVRGIWRRIPCKSSNDSNVDFDEYLKDSPAWETVLDIDALGKHNYALLSPTPCLF